MAVDKVTKTIQLDLSKVPKEERTEVKQQVGEFIVNETLRAVAEGKSPVSGESFKRLSKKYADEEKLGDRTPNLELEGDMLSSLKFEKRKGDAIEVGIFSSREVPKADGHNNFSGDSSLPRRRFIPKDDQEYKRDIKSGIKRIVRQFEREEPPRIEINPTSGASTNITVNDILSTAGGDRIIGRLFGEGNGENEF